MIKRIFTIENNQPVPTVHCYLIPELKAVIDEYPLCYVEALAFCFYMTCPYESENTYYTYSESERLEILTRTYNTYCFFPDDPVIIDCMEYLKQSFRTMRMEYLDSIKESLHKTMKYLRSVTAIYHGKDGNLTEIQRIQKEAGAVITSLTTLEKDVEKEKEDFKARGNRKSGYDE